MTQITIEQLRQTSVSRRRTEHVERKGLGHPDTICDCVIVVFQNEIQPGSPELVDIFARAELTANDTSAAVGYAPLTETEQLVWEAERYLNSPAFKQRFPEIGEDIKVMAFRLDRRLSLTVAAAFVDWFVPDARTYFERKAVVREELQRHLEGRLTTLDEIDVALNTLDDPSRGVGGMYLTVLGTSADGGRFQGASPTQSSIPGPLLVRPSLSRTLGQAPIRT